VDFQPPGELTEADLAAIDDLLARAGGDIYSVEILDGFFTALIVSPAVVLPSQWLPHVLGAPDDPGRPGFESLEQARSGIELLMRHWNAIATAFADGEYWEPIVAESDADRPGHRWAMGFFKGVGLTPEPWASLGNDDRTRPLRAIMALAYEDHPNPARRSPPITPGMRDELLLAITIGLPKLYAHFRSGPPDWRRRPAGRARARRKRKGR